MHTDVMTPTEEEIRSALLHLSADCSRDEWARHGMAIKSELGDAGFSLFDEWSQGGSNYNKRDCRSTWKSIKAAGSGNSITIASLFKSARAAGWRPERRELSEEQKQARERVAADRRRARAQAEKEERFREQAWRRSYVRFFNEILPGLVKSVGSSPYLGAKQVGAHGLLFPRDPFVMISDEQDCSVRAVAGWAECKRVLDSDIAKDRERYSIRFIKRNCFLVPLRDVDGLIYSVQIIFCSGRKSFPRNAPKSGMFHLMGEPRPGKTLAVAEGYATAASIHEATGWPCAVALDVNNMSPVARKLQQKYPDSPLMLCGDDDVSTPGNPGRTLTTALAKQLGCRAVFPQFGAMR